MKKILRKLKAWELKYSKMSWHPLYNNLVNRAKVLGWNGCGSLWNLCNFCGVDSSNCAGPNRKRGIEKAIYEIDEVLLEREDRIKQFLMDLFG